MLTITTITYTILPADDRGSHVVMHPNTAAALACEKYKSIVLSFGSSRIFAELDISNAVEESNLSLSTHILDVLHLPTAPRYELKFDDSELVIGPCIGVLLSSKKRTINPMRLEKAHLYVNEYAKLHGAVIIFDLSGADKAKRLILGYCYNPYTDEFERGVFPYPNAIYRKTGLSYEWKNHFLSVIGNRLFNNPYFSKWRMHEWLSGDESLREHLPYTEIMKNAESAFALLESYGAVYIKPLLGLRGHGIIRLSKSDESFLIETRQQDENSVLSYATAEEAAAMLSHLTDTHPCMVQQGIRLVSINNRLIDFRCVMQKNQTGGWECKAIIARMGKKGSVVSNVSSGGRALTMEEFLQRAEGQYEWELATLPEKLSQMALLVCGRLDKAGAVYGMLGLDIAVDVSGKLWIIEVNNRDPDPSIALNIHDRRLYEELKVNLMRYAKWLAGF